MAAAKSRRTIGATPDREELTKRRAKAHPASPPPIPAEEPTQPSVRNPAIEPPPQGDRFVELDEGTIQTVAVFATVPAITLDKLVLILESDRRDHDRLMQRKIEKHEHDEADVARAVVGYLDGLIRRARANFVDQPEVG